MDKWIFLGKYFQELKFQKYCVRWTFEANEKDFQARIHHSLSLPKETRKLVFFEPCFFKKIFKKNHVKYSMQTCQLS